MTTAQHSSESSATVLPEIPDWLCLCLLAALALGMLGKVLFISPHEVLSDERMDLAGFFVHWRYFGFHELKAGNLALWNPHYYCGAPFFGNFQSALLYPLNFLYLLAPLDIAINWTIALHVFLAGVFTFYWVRWRGLHSLSCLLAAMMFMFCGPHFLQIRAGHLPNLCTLIWAPLLFLAIDKLASRPSLAPCLLGMFVVAMSVLAGHPQFVFYMGVGAGIYAVLTAARSPQCGKVLLGLAGMVIGGIALSAVQLFTGMGEASESMRSLGLSYEIASTYSFPPENFLTLLAPWFFGGGKNFPYWGRWYVTEVSLFVSVMGLVLAVYGMAYGRRVARRFSVTMLIITLVLALGGYTPLFRLLFNYVPGFNLFRGIDKFLWLAALFLSMLAGVGLDQLLRERKSPWWLILGASVAGIALCCLTVLPLQLDWWAAMLKSFATLKGLSWSQSLYVQPHFIGSSSAQAIRGLAEGAASLFLVSGLFALARSQRRWACVGMLLMAMIELTFFAQVTLMSFPINETSSPGMAGFLAEHPGDYRIKSANPNTAMSTGALDIGGGDPSGLLRYARFVDFTAGFDFDSHPFDTPLDARAKVLDTRAWRMLRCRYVFSEGNATYTIVDGTLPRVLLVNRFLVLTNYHEIFSTLTNASFHPEEEVILEQRPDPAPQPGGEKGVARVIQSSTDFLTIEADAKAPSLLLITDAYSKGWRALALPGSSQSRYQVMPANYCLRAIPLAAGHHLLRLEYSPLGFRIGKIVSLIAWPIFIALGVMATGVLSRNGSTRS